MSVAKTGRHDGPRGRMFVTRSWCPKLERRVESSLRDLRKARRGY